MSTETIGEAIEAVAESASEPKLAISDVMLLMQQMGVQQNAALMEAIRELKKPSEAEQAKEDAERQRSMELTMRRVQSAKEAEGRIAQRRATCSHTRKDGKTAMRGQVLSNGFSQAFCPMCHYLSKPFQLAPHEQSGGLNMGDWVGNVYALVESRAKNSPPPPPIMEVPHGATIIFGES